MIDHLLAYLAPHLFCGCGQTGPLLCESCKENITDSAISHCLLCSRPASHDLCSEHREYVAGAFCGNERRGTLERLIDAYKFEYAKAAAVPLADILLARLPQLPADTIIVPVPTIAPHIRQRGYDHTMLLARRVARCRRYRAVPLLGRRTNSVQRDATRVVRERQATEAFRALGPVDPRRPYLLIDDVATTGATLRAAVQVLRDAGAVTIYVAAVARQPLD